MTGPTRIETKIQTIELHHLLRFNEEFTDYAFNEWGLESYYAEAKWWMGVNWCYFVEIS